MKIPDNNNLFTWIIVLYFQSDHSKCFVQIVTDTTAHRMMGNLIHGFEERLSLFIDFSCGSWTSALLDLFYHWRYPSLSFRIFTLLGGWLGSFLGVWNKFDRNRSLTCSFIPRGCPCLSTNLKKKYTNT